MSRDGGERLERRDRGARSRGGRLRALDVERRGEAHAVARRTRRSVSSWACEIARTESSWRNAPTSTK